MIPPPAEAAGTQNRITGLLHRTLCSSLFCAVKRSVQGACSPLSGHHPRGAEVLFCRAHPSGGGEHRCRKSASDNVPSPFPEGCCSACFSCRQGQPAGKKTPPVGREATGTAAGGPGFWQNRKKPPALSQRTGGVLLSVGNSGGKYEKREIAVFMQPLPEQRPELSSAGSAWNGRCSSG